MVERTRRNVMFYVHLMLLYFSSFKMAVFNKIYCGHRLKYCTGKLMLYTTVVTLLWRHITG